MIAANLVQSWWQVALVIIGIVLLRIVRHAIRRARLERAQTDELRNEWEIYQRRHGQ